jgi:hypothetical protein
VIMNALLRLCWNGQRSLSRWHNVTIIIDHDGKHRREITMWRRVHTLKGDLGGGTWLNTTSLRDRSTCDGSG